MRNLGDGEVDKSDRDALIGGLKNVGDFRYTLEKDTSIRLGFFVHVLTSFSLFAHV